MSCDEAVRRFAQDDKRESGWRTVNLGHPNGALQIPRNARNDKKGRAVERKRIVAEGLGSCRRRGRPFNPPCPSTPTLFVLIKRVTVSQDDGFWGLEMRLGMQDGEGCCGYTGT